MKYINKIILFLLIVGSFSYVHANSHMGKSGKVIVVMRTLRSETAKYVYEDLSKGLKKLGVKATIEMKPYSKMNASLFDMYDVVVAVSEKHRDTLDPNLQPFVKANAKNPKLLIVSFLPGRNPGMVKTPPGVDALTSSSLEKPAIKFVTDVVSREVIKRINMM